MRLFLFFVFCFALEASAQVLTPEQFIQQVRLYHPLAKQATLEVEKAKAELLSVRGNFDPALTFQGGSKTFDGKNYYSYANPEVKVPTRLAGLDLKAGLENNGGQFLNSENTAGQSSYLGFVLPVGKGLITDQRRTALQQALIYRSMSEQEKRRMVNDLLFDAYVGYWQWAGAYQLYSIYSNFLRVSTDRLRLVRLSFQQGDRSAIDTLEALTQVQNFEMLQADAAVKLNTSSLELSNFLWDENDSAYALSPKTLPDTTQFALYQPVRPLNDVMEQAMLENPTLRSYDYKLDALEAEKRLKFQSMLPVVNLKANLLNQGYNVFKDFGGALFQNNYLWGIDVKFPLFIREGRGDYQKAKLKIQETNYQLNAKRWETQNKVRNYYTETALLQKQIRLTQQAFTGFSSLLKAENLRFQNGESSLFLVNTRENKVIETAEKLINLRVKYLKANYAVDWAAGLLR
ncbi:MAG: TolC family protein [Sphingobacteriia bacterium]|nr:MAG: TolC family protein [Sphingobacteriia bacterium]